MNKYLLLPIAALILMGQSCTLSFGDQPTQDGGVFRSDDHAESWEHKVFVSQDGDNRLTINNVSVLTFAFDPVSSQRIFLGTRENGIWKTENRGDRWEATSLRTGSYRCIGFNPEDPDMIYTASGTTLLRSDDGGAQWENVYNEAQPNHLVTCVIADPVDPELVWATTSGGKVLMSQDQGETWTLMQALDPFEPRRLYIPPTDTGELYIFTSRHGIFHISDRGLAAEDLGDALTTFRTATDIRTVTIPSYEGGWYLGTRYGLLVSHDFARSWEAIPTLVTPSSIAIENVAVNVNDESEIFITIGQKLQRTIDGGQSWEVTNLPTTRIIRELTLDPEDTDRMYFSTLTPLEE